jgi:mRNA-degrading endonuclease toxin of MazEF toxin-antitoxin module
VTLLHIGGGKERRPFVVVEVDGISRNSSDVIVAALTKFDPAKPPKPLPLNVYILKNEINRLSVSSYVVCNCLHTLNKDDFDDFLGTLSVAQMWDVTHGIAVALIPPRRKPSKRGRTHKEPRGKVSRK